MKKGIFVAGVMLLVLTSCKKEYNCYCVTPPTSTTTTIDYTIVMHKMSRKKAVSDCHKRAVGATERCGLEE